MKIIGFNGPSRSGKTSVAREIDARFDLSVTPTLIRNLSQPMRDVGFALLREKYSDERYEEIKDLGQGLFFGQSLRGFMIQFSEALIKPTYGHTFWARSLWNEFKHSVQQYQNILMLIPDIGFYEEVVFLEEQVETDNFLLVQLDRDGYESWGNDSRRYVQADNTIRINNSSIEYTGRIVLDKIEDMGWDI